VTIQKAEKIVAQYVLQTREPYFIIFNTPNNFSVESAQLFFENKTKHKNNGTKIAGVYCFDHRFFKICGQKRCVRTHTNKSVFTRSVPN